MTRYASITVTPCSTMTKKSERAAPGHLKSESQTRMGKCPHKDCKKKVGLVDFPCKCSTVYCAAHRAPETHACTFDYKQEQKKNLLQYMSTAVISKKIEVL